jgi:hypothetical protein
MSHEESSNNEEQNPFSYEASQNAKGFFQLKFKGKFDEELTQSEIRDMIHRGLVGIKEGVEKAGGQVQTIEQKKSK